MAQVVAGLFSDSVKAGNAVAELKQQGFTEDISVVAREEGTGEVTSEQVKQNVEDGTVAGAVTGAVGGGLLGLLAGAVNVAVPGVGALLVFGPLAALWGLTGGALGALAGGLIGALVDAGFPEERARLYEDRVREGEVLVAVDVEEGREDEVVKILGKHGVEEVGMTEEE